MSPIISIIIPAYNSERYLADTLTSVLAQTFSSWEALVVIDPQTEDQTSTIAEQFALRDDRIRIFRGTQPGVAATRNLALRTARGEYLAFLDSDDRWEPTKLAFQITAMIASDASLSCTAFRRLSADGVRQGREIKPPRRITYARLQQQNCILMSSAMVKRSLVGTTEFHDIGCEDFAFWLEILSRTPSALGIQKVLLNYRIVASSRGSNKWRSLRESWDVLRARPKASLPQTLFHISMLSARGAIKHARF